MAKKKISIGSWAYSIGPYQNNPIPFDQVVKKLAELGFDGVELGGFPPHPNPDDCPDLDSRKRVKDMVHNAGLEFSGLAANLWMHKLVTAEDSRPLLNEVDKNLRFARDLGIKTVRVDTLDPPDAVAKVGEATARKRVIDAFTETARRAADDGIDICWEFEPGFAFNKPSEIIDIVSAVNSKYKNFGVLYDTCHANMVAKMASRQPGTPEKLPGGALELLQKLKGKITHIHLIDSDDTCHKDASGADETSAHPPFGEGNLDFDKLTPALLDCGVQHDWWPIDLCFWSNAWEATEKCQKYLANLRTKFGVG